MRINLDSAVTQTVANKKLFKNFNITPTEQDINEFITIDDGSSDLFHEEILEEANLFLEETNRK